MICKTIAVAARSRELPAWPRVARQATRRLPVWTRRTATSDSEPTANILAGERAVCGILPSQQLRARIATGAITANPPIGEDQIQPASVDLRLGDTACRVRASFLPGPGITVMQRIEALGMHRFDLQEGAVLEKGCVYIVPLLESLRLDEHESGIANPKSSTGRLDVFTRLITDDASLFDQVAPGYSGPLYAEISPRTFSVVVRAGSRLNQLRLRAGRSRASSETATAHVGLAAQPGDERGIDITVDLAASGNGEPVGYRARHHTALIDFAQVDAYDQAEFWEPIYSDRLGSIVLNPGDFYILASAEAVVIPPDHAAEMRPYDTRVGEFRVHYAGFFDPGFGHTAAGGAGSRAVLEIRSFEVPFVLRHGQLVGRLVYERLCDIPDKLYGRSIGSSYQRQGLALAKQFRRAPTRQGV
jgi:dCTP deaminase